MCRALYAVFFVPFLGIFCSIFGLITYKVQDSIPHIWNNSKWLCRKQLISWKCTHAGCCSAGSWSDNLTTYLIPLSTSAALGFCALDLSLLACWRGSGVVGVHDHMPEVHTVTALAWVHVLSKIQHIYIIPRVYT